MIFAFHSKLQLRKLLLCLSLIILFFYCVGHVFADQAVELADVRKISEITVQTNRLNLAVLEFQSKSSSTALRAWLVFENYLLKAHLKEIKTIRILPESSIEYAIQNLNIAISNPVDEVQLQKLGRLVQAQQVVWFTLRRGPDGWIATCHILDVPTGRSVVDINIASADLYGVSNQLVDRILKVLQIRPTDREQQEMRLRWTASSAAMELYGNGNYRQAVEVDPHFEEAYVLLAATLYNEGKWRDAEKAAREALRLKPADSTARSVLGASLLYSGNRVESETELLTAIQSDSGSATAFTCLGCLYQSQNRRNLAIVAYTMALQLEPHALNAISIHAQLGYLYALQENREKAMVELNEASQGKQSSIDLGVEQSMGNAYKTLGEISLAIRHCENYIKLAKERQTNPEQVEAFEKFLLDAKPRLTPVYFTNSLPMEYTEQSLATALNQKLTTDELSLLVNPLLCTPEMDRWAHDLTKDATNDVQKAKMLFEALTRRARSDTLLPPQLSMTAQEAFAELGKSEPLLHCQQTTFLFVALARAVGLEAYSTSVEEAYDGGKALHGCAAVYINGRMLLVDPTYYWFGAPHRRFTVLNDLQTLAIYLCTCGDLKRIQIASKLAPDLALVQYNLCWSLISLERWTDARELLPIVIKLDSIGILANSLQATFAIHAGMLDQGVGMLQKAIEIDPYNYVCYLQLGKVFVAQGRLNEARDAFQDALRCPHTENDAMAINQYMEEINTNKTSSLELQK